MIEGEQARNENTGEYDYGEVFLHGFLTPFNHEGHEVHKGLMVSFVLLCGRVFSVCKFLKPLIHRYDERRGLVFFGGYEHQPKNSHRREEATVRPGEEVERGQHEFEEVSGEEDHPMRGGMNPLEHEQEGQCEEDAVMVPDDG